MEAPLLENEGYRQGSPTSTATTASVSTFEEPDERTTTLSSNVSFLLGGILYVWIAVWDITAPLGGIPASPLALFKSPAWTCYDVLSAAAPFLYVFNAAIDIRAAFRNKEERLVTLVFGIAAILDMIGTLVEVDNVPVTSIPAAMAVHFYLIEAVLAVFGGLYDYNTKTANDLLKGGDFLFFVGSLIDVFLVYLPATRISARGMQAGSLLSAVLWLVDAILYILADEYERRYDPLSRPPDTISRPDAPITVFEEEQDLLCTDFKEEMPASEMIDEKDEAD